ncbi:MAG TPA: TAXI family TRAP transporter solute-binding subunit [Steroidobacteraceae bacterium]|nr:TAXI family TRAP transporter solute-binding subunit [Steroidobacteraceae bacterium]
MATGAPGSAYARVAEQYREVLAQDGIRLRLAPTQGAVDNVRLLTDPNSGVGVGFIQAGVIAHSDTRHLVSLGTVFYEEMWVFCRCPEGTVPLRHWDGWRVSIGPEGSASHPLALRLLSLNGVDPGSLRLFAYPPEAAAQALLARQLDAALILTGWESPVVQSLARAPGITLLGFPRADAYAALDPDFSKVVLPMGVADLAANRPPADTPLIASKASLVVRKDVHRALQFLLVRAAMEVHGRPGMFQRAGEFPAAEEIDVPLSKEARDLYRSGPTLLQRTLPFWLAELVQRLLILIVPIAGIIYPLWSLVPRIYHWFMRRHLDPMFRELRLLEHEMRVSPPGAHTELVHRLDQLERRARELPMPGFLVESTYNLWASIQDLRERVQPDGSEPARESPPGRVSARGS